MTDVVIGYVGSSKHLVENWLVGSFWGCKKISFQ